MELRSRSVPPPMERSQSTENTTSLTFAIPPSQTRPTSSNPFESSSPDDHRAGPASPTRSRRYRPDPFEDRDIRGWTSLRDDKPGWQSSDFEENRRGYFEGSSSDRFQIERHGQPERETAFRPILSWQDSRPYQEDFERDDSWRPLVQNPRLIKTSVSWEHDCRPEPVARQEEWEPSQSRGRINDTLRLSPVQDRRPLDYTRVLPDHNLRRVSPPRYVREQSASPMTRGRPEQRLGQGQSYNPWRPRRNYG